MEVNDERFDKALHAIPVVIKELRAIEQHLMQLRQQILTSIEDKVIEDGTQK